MSYRQIFDEAIGQAPPSAIDIEAVVRRQRRAARVRPALATLAAAAVVATGGGVALQLTAEDPQVLVPPVQVPVNPLDGIPEYFDGTRQLAGTDGGIDERQSFTVTPTMLDLVLHARCEPDQPVNGMVVLQAELAASVAESTTILQWFCTVDDSGPAEVVSLAFQDADRWRGFWDELTVGEPVTIEIEVVAAQTTTGEWLPEVPDGTFQVSVAERVPFEEYEFPPRPAVLALLPDAGRGTIELRADAVDPNRRIETTMTWRDEYGCGESVGYPFSLTSQTPGSLRVFVNGVEMGERTWWDYEQREVGFLSDAACDEVADGEMVTLAVQPEHMTGDWRVWLRTVE
jgi:hypothetical protein